MQLIPKSKDPTSTRTNIKSFLTKYLKNKNNIFFFFLVKPKKRDIKLVFLYQCKQVRYACAKNSYHLAIIYR